MTFESEGIFSHTFIIYFYLSLVVSYDFTIRPGFSLLHKYGTNEKPPTRFEYLSQRKNLAYVITFCFLLYFLQHVFKLKYAKKILSKTAYTPSHVLAIKNIKEQTGYLKRTTNSQREGELGNR